MKQEKKKKKNETSESNRPVEDARALRAFPIPLHRKAIQFPCMAFEAPDGPAFCWNGLEGRWEDWDGEVLGAGVAGVALPDVGYLPDRAKFYGVLWEGCFHIVDIFDPSAVKPLGAESRQAALSVLRRIMIPRPSHKHKFVSAEKVEDAKGLANFEKKHPRMRVLNY